ncbi:MAG: ABC transporter permease subunit [Acidimicrobiia bacterium]
MSRLAELFVLGSSFGALFALMGVSVTLVYQAARIPNVAFVGIGTASAMLHWELATPGGRLDDGMGWWPALVPALAFAALLGAATHLLVRAFSGRLVPSLLLLLGWTAALLAGVHAVWGTETKFLPAVWNGPPLAVGDVVVGRQPAAAVALAGVCGLGLWALMRRTRLGLALRMSAADPDGAHAVGVDGDRLSLLAWLLSAVAGSVALILIAYPTISNTYESSVYLPFAFGAALFGGFRSLPLAAAGGLALGVVPTLLSPSDNMAIGGVPNVVALLMIMVLLIRRPSVAGPEPSGEGPGVAAGASASPPIPRPGPATILAPWARLVGLVAVGLVLAVAVPALSSAEALAAWTQGLSIFLVCASMVMALGWAGDVALGQVAFAGIGAFMAANFAARIDLPHILSLPLAAATAVVVAVAVNIPALRAERKAAGGPDLPRPAGLGANLRPGLRLPTVVVSVGVMVAASSLLWAPNSRWFTGGEARLRRPDWMDLFGGPGVSYYLICLAVTAAVVWFAANLRSSRVGRALAAAKESPAAAKALGIDPLRCRLAILVFSAFVAAVGGIVHAYQGGAVEPARFASFLAIQYLLYVVVGGTASLAGVAGVVFAFEVAPALGGADAISGSAKVAILGLLAVAVLRFAPGGLSGLARRAAAAVPGLCPPVTLAPASVTLPREEVDLDAW